MLTRQDPEWWKPLVHIASILIPEGHSTEEAFDGLFETHLELFNRTDHYTSVPRKGQLWLLIFEDARHFNADPLWFHRRYLKTL